VPARVFHDGPISSPEEDELDIVPFVTRLARPLLDWPSEQSLVLGLYGSWGQGKSSVLRLLWSALEARSAGPQAVVVPFNPWYHSSETGLLYSFFGTIAEAIGSSPLVSEATRKAVAKGFRALGAVVGPIATLVAPHAAILSLANPTLKAVGELLDGGGQTKLEKEKSKLGKALQGLTTQKARPARVVVLIDDLDRLDDLEVRAMLKLVKAVADLPNVSYVLAVDDARVRQVLTATYSDAYGQSFLEKIVQVPVHMPAVSAQRLETIVKRGVTEVVREATGESELEVFPRSEFASLDFYAETLGRRVRTLRDRARLLNVLRFMLLAGDSRLEVYPEDALLVAFLQTFFPDVYKRVAYNKEFLTGEVSAAERMRGAAGQSEGVKRDRAATLNRIITGVPDSANKQALNSALQSAGMDEVDLQTVRTIVERLFPNAEQGFEFDEESDSQIRRHNRVAHPERFERYFRLEAPRGEVSDELVDNFVAALLSIVKAEEPDAAESQAIQEQFSVLDTLSGEGARDSFVGKVRDRISSIPSGRALRIARGIEAATRPAALDGNEAERLLRGLAKRALSTGFLDENASREKGDRDASEIVVTSLQLIPDLLAVVRMALAYVTNRVSGIVLSEEGKKTVAAAALSRFVPIVQERKNIFEGRAARDAMAIVWNWRDLLRFLGQDMLPIQAYFTRLLRDQPIVVESVLRGVAVERTTGVFSFDDGASGRQVLTALEQVIGVNLLVQACEEVSQSAESADQSLRAIVEAFRQLVASREDAQESPGETTRE
jgi:hypothetical protein